MTRTLVQLRSIMHMRVGRTLNILDRPCEIHDSCGGPDQRKRCPRRAVLNYSPDSWEGVGHHVTSRAEKSGVE